MDNNLEEKDYSRNQYETNSKYKRHTGHYIHEFQRHITGEKHWRKMGDIEKKYTNVNRRRNVKAEMNETGKNSCIYKFGRSSKIKNEKKPKEMMENMKKAIKNNLIDESKYCPSEAMYLHKYKYIPQDI